MRKVRKPTTIVTALMIIASTAALPVKGKTRRGIEVTILGGGDSGS